jgi:hypothetical protein
MIEKRYWDSLLRYSTLLFCIAWLLYMMQNAQVPADVGDGIAHYFISKASWQDPSLFLHHWGKPFYILLSSPFSQFGFNGLVVFNILVFSTTVLIGYQILKQFKVSIWLQILFPLILLKAHDVANTLLGGLTEPLFNLAVMLALYLLLNKRYVWFAVIVSLLPFMRSEGQLPVLLALILLVYNKSYKCIPLLFTGFTVYAIIGAFVYGDLWWYFTESPYSMSNAIYGQGSWMHYLLSYKNYLGNPGLYILLLGIPAMFVLAFQRKWHDLQLEWWLFAYGIFMGVLFSHSYFYATGTNGSYGLTRIATQGMPIFLLLHLYYISQFRIANNTFISGLFAVFTAGLIGALITTKYFPKKANPLDTQIIASASYLKKLDLKQKQIFFYSPLLCFSLGENNYDPHSRMQFFTFSNLDDNLKMHFKPGDLIVRDSHFGPLEMNLKLEDIKNHPELIKRKEFISTEQIDDALGEVEGVIIYEYVPINR